MLRAAATLLVLLSAGWARAASPDPASLLPTPEVQVKSRALVRQLGSEEYAEREDAQEKLSALGRLARTALVEGANTSPDPEVRRRCFELLPAATAADVKAKIETFLADVNGEYEHDLPAWQTFRTVVRSRWSFLGRTVWADRELDRAAREVFAEMLASSANRRLLVAVNGSRVELTDLVVARRQELYARRAAKGEDKDTGARETTLDEIAALLFADSRVGSQYVPRRGSMNLLLNTSGFLRAARGKDAKARVYRAVAAAWLDSRNEPREMYSSIVIAADLELTDQACALSAKLLMMPGVPSAFRTRGATNFLEYGTKKHLALLDSAAGSVNVVASVPANGTTYDIQLRDVVLAISLLLTNQKLADYGFIDSHNEPPSVYDTRLYTLNRYYFPDDEARKKAFAKWAAWRKAHADD